MTISLRHAFQSTKPDGADTSLVRPSDWNADHVLTMDSARLLGRTSAGNGAAEEIAVSPARALAGGKLLLSLPSTGDAAVLFTDFYELPPFSSYAQGSAASAAISMNGYYPMESLGLLLLYTGTATNGLSYASFPTTNPAANRVFAMGAGYPWVLETAVKVDALADGTNGYSLLVGFAQDVLTLSSNLHALAFHHDPSVYGDQKWRSITRAANAQTTMDTGVTPSAASFQKLRIEVNAAGTQAAFHINDALVTTHTTNIPVGGGGGSSWWTMGAGAGIQKKTGTTGRACYVDYFLIAALFPSGRPVA